MSAGVIITLFAVGIILLMVEIFVVPGFGVSGILGIAALITGIVFVSDSIFEAIAYLAGSILFLGILFYLSFRFPATKRFWQRLTLSTRQTNQAGYVAPKPNYENYTGKQGLAITQLRPAGTGDFNGERLDVVTEGGFIKAGSKIRIISVEGTRIIVRESQD